MDSCLFGAESPLRLLACRGRTCRERIKSLTSQMFGLEDSF
ncbi:hypothetical protein NBRC111894_1294 [Sporolactobacillus inulinus]|uniref:Uncharacterized protein n=1 Tax=Sporolactobacillus inulinus TaxID=2078 RepID=A0A4Y1Z9N3_9BACL|nr:hypothetical protein NBRC111894_1294 [Sporolactobacillus inulinus]